jgi:hypothetical protein
MPGHISQGPVENFVVDGVNRKHIYTIGLFIEQTMMNVRAQYKKYRNARVGIFTGYQGACNI